MGVLIHIDEDDWGLRKVYPAVAEPELGVDMQRSSIANERNRDPAGFGWSDIYIISPPSVSYADMGLLIVDAGATLGAIMPRVRSFYATSGVGFEQGKRDPHGSYDDDAWCFGFGRHCYLKLDIVGEFVEWIWFDWTGDDQADVACLRRSIEALDRLVPSVIADYRSEMFGRVGDASFLDRYFSQP